MDTLDCVRVLEGHNEAVLALAVGPSFLVSGSYDTTVRFWALDSLRCVRCASLFGADTRTAAAMLCWRHAAFSGPWRGSLLLCRHHLHHNAV